MLLLFRQNVKLMNEVDSLRSLLSKGKSVISESEPPFAQIDSVEAYEELKTKMENKQFKDSVVSIFTFV
jgi:hypothetical protein